MATTGNQGGNRPATRSGSKPAARGSTTRRSTTRRTTARRSASSRRATRATTTSTQPKKPVEQAQEIAERALLVPVGASLLASDTLVSTVKEFATKYRSRTGIEREFKRYERRGVT